MAKCDLHPGREGKYKLYGESYCEQCAKGIAGAQKLVSKHVEPKDCFIWYAKKDNWEPISGTGCAHWVSHQLNIKNGSASDKCLAGYTYRVKTMIQGHSQVKKVIDVKAGDIYVTPDKKHTGLVIKVAPPKTGGDPSITIKHDSSGQGKVATDEFAVRFKGKGDFFR
jgi:hypothetical protein